VIQKYVAKQTGGITFFSVDARAAVE